MEDRTFVLVPGAWFGAWAWNRITEPLRSKGYRVYPVTLTGMGDRVHLANPEFGMEVAIRDVINLIEFEDLHRVILVGHSFAGKVAAAVQDRIPERIETILFLDAIRPDKIRTPQCGKEGWSQKDVDGFMERRVKEGWKFPLTHDIIEEIGKDLEEKDRKWFLSKVTPWPVKLLMDSITLSENYDRAKKANIFCTGGGDNVEEILKGGVDGKYRVIESGHWPMITKPNELVDAMIEVVT